MTNPLLRTSPTTVASLRESIMAAIKGGWGRRVNLLSDIPHLAQGITIPANQGLRLSGDSMGYPTLIWDGDMPNGALFTFENTRDTIVEGMRILIKGRLGAVFRYLRRDAGPGSIPPTNNQRRDIMIEVQQGGYLRHGIEHLNVEYGNNDCGVDSSVHISNAAEAGWYFEGVQCKAHRLRDCRVNGGGITKHAVMTVNGASFVWEGGGSSGLTGPVFLLGEPSDPIAIRDHDGDPSHSFLTVTSKFGRTADTQVVLVSGGRFMCQKGITSPDNIVVNLEAAGPYKFQSWQLGSGNQPVGLFRTDALGKIHLDLDNVQLDAYGSADTMPVIGPPGAAFVALNGVRRRKADGTAEYWAPQAPSAKKPPTETRDDGNSGERKS